MEAAMREVGCIVIAACMLLPGYSAGQVWVREVVDTSPINQLCASAVNYNGQMGVVYRKRVGLQPETSMVMATRALSGWQTQTVTTAMPNENYFMSDATTINGVTYVAV